MIEAAETAKVNMKDNEEVQSQLEKQNTKQRQELSERDQKINGLKKEHA